jgi:hypothetical protein
MGRVITRLWVLEGLEGAEYFVGSGGVTRIVHKHSPHCPNQYQIIMLDGGWITYPAHLVGVEWTTIEDEQYD